MRAGTSFVLIKRRDSGFYRNQTFYQFSVRRIEFRNTKNGFVISGPKNPYISISMPIGSVLLLHVETYWLDYANYQRYSNLAGIYTSHLSHIGTRYFLIYFLATKRYWFYSSFIQSHLSVNGFLWCTWYKNANKNDHYLPRNPTWNKWFLPCFKRLWAQDHFGIDIFACKVTIS